MAIVHRACVFNGYPHFRMFLKLLDREFRLSVVAVSCPDTSRLRQRLKYFPVLLPPGCVILGLPVFPTLKSQRNEKLGSPMTNPSGEYKCNFLDKLMASFCVHLQNLAMGRILSEVEIYWEIKMSCPSRSSKWNGTRRDQNEFILKYSRHFFRVSSKSG